MEAVDWEVVEAGFYGIIDGLSSYLTNDACSGGMAGVVDSAFRMVDNIAIYNPVNTMKFAMASNNFQDSTNTVVAWCDFSSYSNKIANLFGNYRAWENYARLAGRVGGAFIADWTPNYQCITEGIDAGVGHDVGLCVARLTSIMLDSVL